VPASAKRVRPGAKSGCWCKSATRAPACRRTSPSSGRSRPASRRKRVVLPTPLGPTRPARSPACSSKPTFSDSGPSSKPRVRREQLSNSIGRRARGSWVGPPCRPSFYRGLVRLRVSPGAVILVPMSEVTRILSAIEGGDPSAAGQLLPLVYDELRKLAAQKLARETPGQTLDATALVHESYLRLVDVDQAQHWNSQGHFF